MNETADSTSRLPIIYFASSLLQKSVFLSSSYASRPQLLVGNRGISGDLTYHSSVLNDYRFLNDFSDLIDRNGGEVEVFVPHALNSLYYYLLADSRVRRISFIDEGVLTRRFLAGGYRNAAVPFLNLYPSLFRLAGLLPNQLRALAFRVISWLVKRTVGMRYEKDTANYPLRTIELSRKGGVVLSHILGPECLPWVEYVDLTKNINVVKDSDCSACLFVHPKQVAQPDQIDALFNKISKISQDFSFDHGLIKPHPLFCDHPERLTALEKRLSMHEKAWTVVEVTGSYEPTIELYARGVRLFIVSKSSVSETVRHHADYFSNLNVVEV